MAAALVAFSPSSPALAQAYQCSPPRAIGPVPDVRPDGPIRRAVIAGYTLAASWSPEYCKMSRGRSAMQCSGANGRFGFVLHGLWPEARSGPPPQWCAPRIKPSAELLRRNLCMTPAPELLVHEWAKHGSCMVASPERYWRVSGILWRSLRWPDADRLARQQAITAGDFRRAFVEANPDWNPRQVGLLASDNGWLREVRLCYDRSFLPTDCPRGRLGPADATPLKIWRGL